MSVSTTAITRANWRRPIAITSTTPCAPYDDAAFWLKVRDVLRGTLGEPAFAGYLEKPRGEAGEPIAADPVEVVEVTARRSLHRSGEERRAAARPGRPQRAAGAEPLRPDAGGHPASQDRHVYDRASELEQIGSQIIELAPGQWRRLVEARGA